MKMTTTNWLLNLKKKGILTADEVDGKEVLHISTPCKIKISEKITQELRDAYDAEKEIGGVLMASPKKINEEVYLEINSVILIKNVSDTPYRSYRKEADEWKAAIKNTFDAEKQKTFPIQFHTHPTHSDNMVNEMMNYVIQINTSEADQVVSNNGFKVGDLNIILPDCLILCNGKFADKMFIGFYNGMIAPIEFKSHRREEITKAMERIFNAISEWAKKNNNGWILFGAGILLLILIVRFPKAMLSLLFAMSCFIPTMVNSINEEPKYFIQLDSKRKEATILIP